MAICEICKSLFESKNIKKPNRTCSKICKNELARQITKKQFADPIAREHARQISLAKKQDPKYQENFQIAIDKRTLRWQEQGHPRLGLKQPDHAKIKIGEANRGRFKGKTWEEIFGDEVANKRKKQNAEYMSKTNETLLKNKRSSLETKLIPFLKGYDNNIQISYYNVDFVNQITKHIIEVYGDYWHCNPKTYPDDYIHPYSKMTAKERRKLDEERVKYLESLEYSVTIVWESDLDDFIRTLQ
jgi:G:T-mismatch repair DNA endonuclease (very short patch repair protein)